MKMDDMDEGDESGWKWMKADEMDRWMDAHFGPWVDLNFPGEHLLPHNRESQQWPACQPI